MDFFTKHSVEDYYHLADKVITAVIIFLLFLSTAWIAGRISRRLAGKNDASLAITLGRLVRNSLMIAGAIVALSSTGANLSGIIAGVGLWAVAVSYGMQYMFANIGAGFMIMLAGEIQKGDRITIAGNTGVIISTSLRYVTLKSGENICVIPNNLFITQSFIKLPKQES